MRSNLLVHTEVPNDTVLEADMCEAVPRLQPRHEQHQQLAARLGDTVEEQHSRRGVILATSNIINTHRINAMLKSLMI